MGPLPSSLRILAKAGCAAVNVAVGPIGSVMSSSARAAGTVPPLEVKGGGLNRPVPGVPFGFADGGVPPSGAALRPQPVPVLAPPLWMLRGSGRAVGTCRRCCCCCCHRRSRRTGNGPFAGIPWSSAAGTGGLMAVHHSNGGMGRPHYGLTYGSMTDPTRPVSLTTGNRDRTKIIL